MSIMNYSLNSLRNAILCALLLVFTPFGTAFAEPVDYKKSRQALLVGVSQQNALIGLPFMPAIGRDLAKMKQLLEEQGYQVTILSNPDGRLLRRRFEELAVMSAPDEFLFYYSGHSADYGDKGFLVPVLSEQASSVARKAADNGGNPFEEKKLIAELVNGDELQNLLKLSLASRQVVIIDGNTRQFCMPEIFAENIRSLHFFCAGPGAVAKPDGGLFTSLIVRGLKGKADKGRDGRVDVLELETWIKRRIPEVLGVKSTLMRNPAFFHFGDNQILSELILDTAE